MPRTIFDKHGKCDKFLTLIRGTAITHNKTYADIGVIMGCHSNTVVHRMNKPENFTIGEMLKIGRALNIPIEELRQSITY